MEYTEQMLEIENRMKNLLWTVSGDYTLEANLNTAGFTEAKYSVLYDAVKQGAMSRYFSRDEFSMYLLKKLYLGADEKKLADIAGLCMDMACAQKISAERKGVENLRRKAYAEILVHNFDRLQKEGLLGQIRFACLKQELDSSYVTQKRVQAALDRLQSLKTADDTMTVIARTDELYNAYADAEFEKVHGGLKEVLAVTIEDLREFDWQDYLDEEMYEDMLEKMQAQVTQAVTELSEENRKRRRKGAGRIVLNEEAVEKMYSYIELNYGRSCLTELEQKQINRRLCCGVHRGCSIYMTEGILKNPVVQNNTYMLTKRTKEHNLSTYRQNTNVTKRNIEVLAAILERALRARNERDYTPAQYGQLRPQRLWKVGRMKEYRLFDKETKKANEEFVVELLLDASGSQQKRQAYVALQGFIVARALSKAGIPHRVMSFCTFWDYTVLQRFRDYEDPAESDFQLFEFRGSSNNRDGLAVRAAADSLLSREEPNKVLIVLSDGRPNDRNVNRPGRENEPLYTGAYAVKDTALEVRRARGQGIAVLGVFMGEEEDLAAERRIFGKDFAYIKNIANFSNVVGTYLKKQLEE